MAELAEAFLRRVGVFHAAVARDFVATYLAEWNQGVSYPSGVPKVLERLSRRFVLAVITNTHDADLVPAHLELMGVTAYVARVVTSVEFGVRKPAPGIFEHALHMLRVSPERCVYVGDDYQADYRGAQAAGIPPLLIDPAGEAPVPDSRRLGSILDLEERLSTA
jgi:putative hydrolase of the HAD superfamily